MEKDAYISEDGQYRYWLSRGWDCDLPTVCFVMLNPSTADAEFDDPTIRRCIGFAKLWGYGRLEVRNLFAYRATDPGQLRRVDDPVGPYGDVYLAGAAASSLVVAAWGCHGELFGRHRAARKLLGNTKLYCLGKTKDGHPKHPLYLPASACLVAYP